MASTITYLITGTNRGIGFGLVTALLANPKSVIFAGVRDPSKADALNALAQSQGKGRMWVVKLSSTSEDDAKEVARLVAEKVGHLDVVIGNAGVAGYFGPVATAPLSEFQSHWDINLLGIVILFQATYPLLLKSPTGSPKFVPMSTGGASLTNTLPLPNCVYGSSKAAMNYVCKKIAMEEKDKGLICFPLCPGWVATDLGNHGASAAGMKAAPVTVQQSCEGIIKVITDSDLSTSGLFMNYDGTQMKW